MVLPPCCFNNYQWIIRKRSFWILLFIHLPTYLRLSWNRTTRYSLPMVHWITWTAPSSSTTKLYTTFVPSIDQKLEEKKKYRINLSYRLIHLRFPKLAIWTWTIQLSPIWTACWLKLPPASRLRWGSRALWTLPSKNCKLISYHIQESISPWLRTLRSSLLEGACTLK